MTTKTKSRKVRHSSPVDGPRAYLLDLMAELDRAAISLRLGESLKTAGIKQPEMADLLHVHKSAVEQYVSPKVKTVPFDRLDEWAKLTGTTKEWLLHGPPAETPIKLSEVLAAVEKNQALLREVLGRIAALEATQPAATAPPPDVPGPA